MWLDEHGWSVALDELDAVAAEGIGGAPLIVHVLGNAAGAGERGGDVELRARSAETEALPRFRVAQ
jgi:hypothetical protein